MEVPENIKQEMGPAVSVNYMEISLDILTLSMGVYNPKKELFLYPMPTKNILYFNQPLTGTYQITDSQGRQVVKGQLDQTISIESHSELKKGMYFFQFLNSEGSHTNHVLVKI